MIELMRKEYQDNLRNDRVVRQDLINDKKEYIKWVE